MTPTKCIRNLEVNAYPCLYPAGHQADANASPPHDAGQGGVADMEGEEEGGAEVSLMPGACRLGE